MVEKFVVIKGKLCVESKRCCLHNINNISWEHVNVLLILKMTNHILYPVQSPY